MLMQNFKSAADLAIAPQEQRALVKVLGMLERAELAHVPADSFCDNGFSMDTHGYGCGTPACVGGWAAHVMGIEQRAYVDSYLPSKKPRGHGLTDLYWNYPGSLNWRHSGGTPNVDQAATALRSYLTTGDARWDLAVA